MSAKRCTGPDCRPAAPPQASRARTAAQASAPRLARAIREVLEEAVAAGGSSLRDHRQTDGALGYFQHSFKVYGRAESLAGGATE